MTTTISAGPPPRPSTPTIDVLPSPTAQLYSYVHPTLLLSLYAIRFPTLVADPVSTLLSDLPVVAALQIAYVVTCLPQAGSVPTPLYQQENLTESGSVQGTPSKRNPSSGSSPSHLLRAGKSPLRRKRSNIHSHSPSKRYSNGITNKLSVSLSCLRTDNLYISI
jgi:GPI ethanolamine phosphate transferase 2/3 subunit F